MNESSKPTNIPITPQESCTAAGEHYLCYRVRCNLSKKCYVKELEKENELQTSK